MEFCDSFPFPHYFTLCTTSAASNTNTHIARRTHTWRHNSIIPVKLFFMTITLHMQKNSEIFFHDYCIRTSHIATHEDTILSFLWNCFSWPLHYICRKTPKFFFMTIAYAEKLGNFNELIICIIRYIKYLVGKQGCK